MLGIHDFWLFVLAGLLLNITPGPDMALVMGRAMRTFRAMRRAHPAQHATAGDHAALRQVECRMTVRTGAQ